MVAAHFRQLSFRAHVALEAETLTTITREVSESGLFTFLADGAQGRPGWRVFAAGNSELEQFTQMIANDSDYHARIQEFTSEDWFSEGGFSPAFLKLSSNSRV